MAEGGTLAANRTRRLIIGFLLLILVDFIWVGSAQLTKFIFTEQKFDRPYFTTYVKTCLFSLYLIGFMFHRPWRDQCMHPLPEPLGEGRDEDLADSADELGIGYSLLVSSLPSRAPPEPPGIGERAGVRADCGWERYGERAVGARGPGPHHAPRPRPHPLRQLQPRPGGISSHPQTHGDGMEMQVRRMPEEEAAAATLSRLPYELWLRAQTIVRRYHYNKLPVRLVAKLALQFCFVWFLGNLAYQEALLLTSAGVVNVLSSSSSLFTLVLAGIFPATSGDKFTLSKLVAVGLSVGGVGVVSWVDEGLEGGSPSGAIWGIVGALSYAFYLVFLRRQVESEEKLDIPMFFGFVGLFSLFLLWPGLWVLNEAGVEPFYPLPNRTQLMYILVNGIVGTVLSEYLWLWGCFLTNSLIATLAISLSIPITVLSDRILWEETYPWTFYLGTIPILVAFVGAAVLAHYENWDPVAVGLGWGVGKLCHFPCLIYRRLARRVPIRPARTDLDREQTQSLIINS